MYCCISRPGGMSLVLAGIEGDQLTVLKPPLPASSGEPLPNCTGGMAQKQALFRSASALASFLSTEGLLSIRSAAEDRAQQKVAFVFGREVGGLAPEEVAACSAVCQLPMGRLQESLSLSHAAAIAMSAAFEVAAAEP